jgi:hypothetical protein
MPAIGRRGSFLKMSDTSKLKTAALSSRRGTAIGFSGSKRPFAITKLTEFLYLLKGVEDRMAG